MTDIKSVLSIRGVCPDMCPEKERLMREATHHAASFELEENSKYVMNHTLAIKQYARSSADQEFPLAHELRPESILQLTMNYLLHNIVDLCEDPDVNLGDWFHFLWDRTRSVRKEISQQELCSQVAVCLVEQCARLHIHCAARLVAEEPQVFDQKINSENLTKCLQSLKYLYHDLHLRNEQCPNEAEFRAYVVLLNLNDCQFFWEVKQLPHHILHSPEIRFAINVYLAVETNNYVKFFKLVRETSYMNACILLRYFTQVRVQALNVILKAYVPTARPVFMSISHWTYCLAFEDFEQSAQFFEYYGLQCDRDGDRVSLDRNAFVYPDVPVLLERAINVVEHKRMCSVGEALHGRSLRDDFAAAFARHQPHDSFDEFGCLLPEAWTADDQNYLRPPTPKLRAKQHHPFAASEQQQQQSKAEDPAVFKVPITPTLTQQKTSQAPKPSIFTKLRPKPDVTDSSVVKKPNKPKKATAAAVPPKTVFDQSVFGGTPAAAGATTTNIFPSVVSSTPADGIFANFPTTTSNVFGNCQEDAAAAAAKPKTSIFGGAQTSKVITIEGISPIVPDEDKASLNRTQMEADRQQLAVFVEQNKAAQRHCDQLLDAFLLDHIHAVATDVLAKHEQLAHDAEELLTDLLAEEIQYEMDAFLTEIIGTINERLSKKYFTIWRQAVRRCRKRREIIETTPIWMPSISEPWQRNDQQMETLGLIGRYRRGRAEAIRGPRARPGKIDIRVIVADAVGKQLKAASVASSMKRRLYWKCVLSVPDENECLAHRKLVKWLDRVFVRVGGGVENVFYCEDCVTRDLSVGVCLRRLTGDSLIDEQGMNGSRSATIGADCILIFIEDTLNLASTKRRIQALSGAASTVPMAIVCHHPGPFDTERLRIKLQLSADSMVYMCGDLRAITQKCMQKLASLPPRHERFTIAMQTTTSLLLQCLGNQFWTRIATSAQSNPGLMQVVTNPDTVIRIYNEAIERLTEICLPSDSVPEFPPEFRRFVPKNDIDIPLELEYFPENWRSDDRRHAIKAFFERLKLKKSISLANCNSIEDAQQCLLTYARSVIGGRSKDADRVGYQMIQSLMTCLVQSTADVQLALEQFSWIEPLQQLTSVLLNVTYDETRNNLPSEIVYQQTDLTAFCSQPWWLQVTSKGSPLAGVRAGRPIESRTKLVEPDIFRIEPDDLNSLLEKGAQLINAADRRIGMFHVDEDADRLTSQELSNSLCEQEHRNRVNKRILTNDEVNGGGGGGDIVATVAAKHSDIVAKRQKFSDRINSGGGDESKDDMAQIMTRATACAERAARTIESFKRISDEASFM